MTSAKLLKHQVNAGGKQEVLLFATFWYVNFWKYNVNHISEFYFDRSNINLV